MKQMITVGQINELSDKQLGQLREWWKPQIGDFMYGGSGVILTTEGMAINKRNCFPLLSTGQMIELLYDNTNDWGIHYNDSGVCFYVYLSWTMETASQDRIFMRDELADALWEAVKKVLSEEEQS